MINLNQRNENKVYDSVLNETASYFENKGVNIFGEGFKEIATNPVLFENYMAKIVDGASANTQAQMKQLIENTNKLNLKESWGGISPMSSMMAPVIRKLWPKFTLKEALATEVAKTPVFSIVYQKPYAFKGDGKKVYLPEGLFNPAGDTEGTDPFNSVKSKEILAMPKTAEIEVTLTAGAAKVIDFVYVDGESGDKNASVYITDTPSATKLQELNELFVIDAKTGDKDIKIGKQLSVYGTQTYNFTTAADVEGQLIVTFDKQNRKAVFVAVGAPVTFKTYATVATAHNEESWSFGIDYGRQDITIPQGQHFNAPLPIEELADAMALYTIDGTKEVVQLMTDVISQKLDLEVLDFIEHSYAFAPTNEAYQGYPTASDYTVTFDCRPAAGSAATPKEWREEIKLVIDTLSAKIKLGTRLGAGIFNLIANPLDVQLLTNVEWQFRGGQGGNVDGVDVDYSVGTFVGANAYRVISSYNVPQGAMYLVFQPSTDKQITSKFYAYSFSTEMGYVDPNVSRVPSIMMTKRHTMYEFLPAMGAIIIQNREDYFNKWGTDPYQWNA